MALINNSAELALECSLDKLWIDYDWYYKWKCFFLHKKWTDKYTCICIRYSKLHDIKSNKYSDFNCQWRNILFKFHIWVIFNIFYFYYLNLLILKNIIYESNCLLSAVAHFPGST